jgi:2-polyprenyl-3-methyl-5-hydroxy-6-metoxy-1,4-benzoquinol methylase
MHRFLNHGQNVLDAGCGTGLISNVFATRFDSQFVAIDISDSIQFGKKYAKENNIKNIKWNQQDLVSFQSKEKFDVIICQGVLHHIPEYELALENLKMMLKPNGILLLGVYNPFGKFLKKYINIRYHSEILYKDQEQNPFELSFTSGQVKQLCNDMQLLSCVPAIFDRYFSNIINIFNSQNGGLVLYAFRGNS